MVPRERNIQLLRAAARGMWIRTIQPPYVAVKWVPDTKDDGRTTFRGQRWQEILPVGPRRRARLFRAQDVTWAPISESLSYPPAGNEPVCGFMLAAPPEGAYCSRAAQEGKLCPKHEAEVASWEDEGEEVP